MRTTEPADWLDNSDVKLIRYSTEPGNIYECNLADHQHEVLDPALFGVHVADLLSDGGPCECLHDTLEDDRA